MEAFLTFITSLVRLIPAILVSTLVVTASVAHVLIVLTIRIARKLLKERSS